MMTQVQREVLAADIRESVILIADAAWKAHDAGLSLEASVELVVTSSEGIVQSLVRSAAR